MILTKTIHIKIFPQNKKHFNNIGYIVVSGDIIEVKVEELTHGSNSIIRAKCDICENDVDITYKLYNRSILKGGLFCCSHKCADVKRRQILRETTGANNISQLESVKKNRINTNVERYGVSHSFQSDMVKDKIIETNLERYGVDNFTKTDEYKDKVKKTNLGKYGVEWSLQSDVVRDKSKKTNLERYGFETPSKSDEVKQKIIETNLERYGYRSPLLSNEIQKKSKETLLSNYNVDNPLKSDIIKKRIRVTNLERYGFEYPIQNNDIKNIREVNNVEKFGTTNNTSSDIFRKENTIIGSDDVYISYIGSRISLFRCDKEHNFEIHTDNYFSRKKQNLPMCTVCHPIKNTISIREQELFEFISSIYDGEIIQSYRDGLEIDIYLPALKIGFEYNGLYWHSEANKDRNYHQKKTKHFLDRDIRIIHIWEDEWIYKNVIQKSMISNMLIKTTTRIFARKCDIIELFDNNIIREFLNNNHIQGYNKTIKKSLGLICDGELVSIMTFDKSEGRKKMLESGWNLSRFCNKSEHTIVGGASKLLKHFIDMNKAERIISYADMSWSNGNLYKKLGFDKISESKPDYSYIINGKRKHKSSYRKSKLKLEVSMTESQYMKESGHLRIYDCGKMKFELLTN